MIGFMKQLIYCIATYSAFFSCGQIAAYSPTPYGWSWHIFAVAALIVVGNITLTLHGRVMRQEALDEITKGVEELKQSIRRGSNS